MSKKAYHQIVEITQSLEPEFKNYKVDWVKSPFERLVNLPPFPKSQWAVEIVSKYLTQNGFDVKKGKKTHKTKLSPDLVVDQQNVTVKFSARASGPYTFQDIDHNGYGILFCLGVSPHAVHAWVAKQSNIDWKEVDPPTGENRHFNCKRGTNGYKWLHPQDGNLSQVCDEFRKLIDSK